MALFPLERKLSGFRDPGTVPWPGLRPVLAISCARGMGLDTGTFARFRIQRQGFGGALWTTGACLKFEVFGAEFEVLRS